MMFARFVRDPWKIAILTLALAWIAGPSRAADQVLPMVDKEIHMGVFSCSGSTCHGAVQSWPNANVLQNEYITWQRRDKHAKAYDILLNEQSRKIAKNLGLESAHTADICLDCHADNVARNQRHGTFQMADGVTCEACHGGAGRWIGTHIAADASHANNIRNGLYPTDRPVERARLCLSCHQGDDTRKMTHRIMGAGHPRLSFELDTFTAIQPAHYRIDGDYRQRKGNWNGVQVWAVGQAIAVDTLLETIIDTNSKQDSLFPELIVFDCHSCHRQMSGLNWLPRETVGLGPGEVRLNDANLLMLQIITAHVEPALGREVKARSLALHKASTGSRAAFVDAAKALRQSTGRLIEAFSKHDFDKEDLEALLTGLIEIGIEGELVHYAVAEQATMALGAVINAMRDIGAIDKEGFTALDKALKNVYAAVENHEAYKSDAMIAALKTVQTAIPN